MTHPLTPADCDLQDFPRMMIDIPRLFASEFDATATDAEWRCGVTLWLRSFHQVPAASLPDDDVQLARLCGLGRDVKSWRKLRAGALRGWVSASDGRLYHPFVAEIALEAWLEKLAQRLSSGAGNAARWGTGFDPEPIKAEIGATAALLAALNPKSKALSKQQVAQCLRQSRRETPPAVPAGPTDVPSGSQEKGREGKEEDTPPSPLPGGERSEAFEVAWAAWHVTALANRGKAEAWRQWPGAAVRAGGEPRLLAAVKAHVAALSASPRQTAKAFHRWLRDDGFEAYVGSAKVVEAKRWEGPAEIWSIVVGAKDEAFARSWLAGCGWQDLPKTILGGRATIKRLRDEVGPALSDNGIELKERAA
ncbi:hypothetical protein [Synechococcus phage Ssp-JY42]|nr:hypothetical protein [Synechococcus phage Yong-M4-211]